MNYRPKNAEESNNYLINLIEKSDHEPFVVSRLGIGQETVTTYNYMACGRFSNHNAAVISSHNGIYCNNANDLITYCRFYDNALKNSDSLALWEPPLVNDIQIAQNYFCNKFKHLHHLNINTLEAYKLLEASIDTNIKPWTHSLLGKKILVINPFVDDFKKQIDNDFKLFNKSNKHLFLENQEFVFYKSYNCLAGNRPHKNWIETYIKMYNDISTLDFDIAILGCGGYGLPLCSDIKTKLGKSAIYIGGIIQILFGVIGKRWEEEEYWKNMIDVENIKFIRPNTNDKINNFDKVEGGCYW